MPDIFIVCAAADRAAANALADSLGAGPNNFSVPLAPQAFSDPAQATVYAGSGVFTDEQAAGLNASVDPLIQVRSNEGKSIQDQLDQSTPPLVRMTESL